MQNWQRSIHNWGSLSDNARKLAFSSNEYCQTVKEFFLSQSHSRKIAPDNAKYFAGVLFEAEVR